MSTNIQLIHLKNVSKCDYRFFTKDRKKTLIRSGESHQVKKSDFDADHGKNKHILKLIELGKLEVSESHKTQVTKKTVKMVKTEKTVISEK